MDGQMVGRADGWIIQKNTNKNLLPSDLKINIGKTRGQRDFIEVDQKSDSITSREIIAGPHRDKLSHSHVQ